MNHVYRLLVCVIATGLVSVSNAGLAGDGPISLMGGTPSPMAPLPNIRMESQEVTVRPGKTSYTVDAVYSFRNDSESITEWVGFPKRGMGPKVSFKGVSDFIRFEARVNDRKVELSEESEETPNTCPVGETAPLVAIKDFRLLLAQVTFAGHAVTTVSVGYEAPYTRPDGYAYYAYGRGSDWKDPVGKAAFVIDASELGGIEGIGVRFSAPDARKYMICQRMTSPAVTRYEINDFKPDPEGRLSIACASLLKLFPAALPAVPGVLSPETETQPGEPPNTETLAGEVVASSPQALVIRKADSDTGGAPETIHIKVGLRTKFIPFRRPAVGEKIEVRCCFDNGTYSAYEVKVVQ